jgi:predicted transglutaminase-like cysteine proteinase
MGPQRDYRCSLTCVALFLQISIGGYSTDLSAAELPSAAHVTPQQQKLNLFGTQEIRGSLTALKSWQTLVDKANQQIAKIHLCSDSNPTACTPVARSWLQMEAGARNKTGMEQIRWINQFFNRWPYRLDLDTYNQRDYWATPEEFMKRSGDCEDFSITKYFALRAIGYPAASLRLVILKDQIRNIAHAILAVVHDSNIYILDNLSDAILIDKRYTHYQPQYSLNENFRWAHIRMTRRGASSH